MTNEPQVPAILYKYVRPERIEVLRSKRIRFTQPTATNDLFELKPIFDSIVPEEDFDSLMTPSDAMLEEAIRHKYDHLAAELRAKVTFSEVMTQVRSRPDLVANAYRDVIPHMRGLVRALTPSLRAKMTELFGRMIGILSLTETPTNQAMWAHYSDSHKGFLLAFDTSNPFFHGGRPGIGEFHYLRRVQYKDRTDGGSSLVQLTGADVFLTKASDWAYEREWRMIAPLGNNPENPPGDDEVVLFDFPPHALIEVVVGARSTPDFRANLSRLVLGDAALAHIKLKEAFVSDQDAAIGIRVLDI